jgi:hypothetical protein
MESKNRKPSANAPVPDTATVAADADAITGAGTGLGANASNRVPKVKAGPKGQYHHIIPRFILRKFIIEGQ